MAASTGSVVTSPHLICFLNGRMFGEANKVEWDIRTPKVRKGGIDSVVDHELAPTKNEVAGSVGMYRIRGTGGLEGFGVVAPFNANPREKYFSILIVNRLDGTTVFRADRCSVTSQRWGVEAKGRMHGTFSFEALEYGNEITAAYE